LLEHPSSLTDSEDIIFHADTYYKQFGSTNGLVCLMGVEPLKLKDGNPEIFVKFWNPCLRLISKKSPCLTIQWQERPHFGFGYDDSSDTYKVSEF